MVVVGAHRLAAACRLTNDHGVTNAAVPDNGLLAGGNTARDTTIIRFGHWWGEPLSQDRARSRGGPAAVHDLAPGRAPARRPVRTHQVLVEDGTVCVKLSDAPPNLPPPAPSRGSAR